MGITCRGGPAATITGDRLDTTGLTAVVAAAAAVRLLARVVTAATGTVEVAIVGGRTCWSCRGGRTVGWGIPVRWCAAWTAVAPLLLLGVSARFKGTAAVLAIKVTVACCCCWRGLAS